MENNLQLYWKNILLPSLMSDNIITWKGISYIFQNNIVNNNTTWQCELHLQ